MNSNTEHMETIIINLNKYNKEAKAIIRYHLSKAVRNKIIKEQQSFKNKGEKLVYFTSEEKYNKYTKNIKKEENKEKNEKKVDIKEMSIYEKWIYFIFKTKS